MKLDPPIRTNVTFDNYLDELAVKGYKCIGSGSFAAVYARKRDKTVIKVGLLDPCDTWNDDGYISFLKVIDTKNPMFPKIKRVERYNYRDNPSEPYNLDNTRRYYVVEMERLVDYYNVHRKTREDTLRKIGIGSIYDFCEDSNKGWKSKWAKRAHNLLLKLWKRSNDDIHDGNVMFRKKDNGKVQMVITDPAT